ncbi:MFS transporter [Nonomuraea deserti]|uniref:MFS transporter n=1 Tax=Nonomuraea deserti TaxID=1848322 RepID=A0A4V2Y984_9ACTN|nr:MFS transporter [Nonomuraea deserti]TDC98865.1 MFS transporter [Nonomuraea deserti]
MRSTTLRSTFLVLAAGCATFAMLQSLITPVLATIQAELRTTQNTVTWVMTANLLSAAVFTPILGRVGDTAGKKRALVAVLLALVAGSLLAALAPDITVLIAARALQGVAGAVFPLSYGIIRDEYPPERVAAGVGGISAVIAAGGGLGIVLAGPIVETLGHTWLFWIPMIIGGGAALATHLLIPDSPPRQATHFNRPAALLLSAWLVSLLLAISKGPEWGWTSPAILGLLITAIAATAAWIATELRSPHPLIDMRMMRLPAVWTTNLVALLFGAGQFALFAFLPQFVQTPGSAGYGFGADVTQAGLLLLPMLATMFAAGLTSGRIEPFFSSKTQLATGSALSVLALAAFTVAHDASWQVALMAAVFGAGLGLAMSSMTNVIVTSVPADRTGVAGGMNANIRTIGGAIGVAVVGSIITATPQPSGLPHESGYTSGFLVLAGVSLAAVAAALIVPSSRRTSRASTGGGTPDPGHPPAASPAPTHGS